MLPTRGALWPATPVPRGQYAEFCTDGSRSLLTRARGALIPDSGVARWRFAASSPRDRGFDILRRSTEQYTRRCRPQQVIKTFRFRETLYPRTAVADRRRNLNPQQDLQYYEIAEILNLSMATAMSKLFYARKKLQSLFRPIYNHNYQTRQLSQSDPPRLYAPESGKHHPAKRSCI